MKNKIALVKATRPDLLRIITLLEGLGFQMDRDFTYNINSRSVVIYPTIKVYSFYHYHHDDLVKFDVVYTLPADHDRFYSDYLNILTPLAA